MKNLIIHTLLALTLTSPVQAQENLEQMFSTAKTMLAKQGYSGDMSAARRLLDVVLAKDPNHPEALWELTYIDHLSPISNSSLHRRANGLAAAGNAINTIVENAIQRKKPAFAHYILARYAAFYKAYDRALEEIENALKLRPDSVKYLYFKGSILSSKGTWDKQDDEILQGIKIIGQARKLNHPKSDLTYSDADFYFQQGWFNSKLTTPRYEKTIEFYQAVIKHKPNNKTDLAFSWNNSSIAYRHLGQCQKAKHAAEQALKVMKFGAARSNLQYAKFCLEMDTLTEEFERNEI